MSEGYSIAEARNHLSTLVHEAESGKPVKLTRRGKPVAVVMSMAAYEALVQPRGMPDWSAVTLDTRQFRFDRKAANER